MSGDDSTGVPPNQDANSIDKSKEIFKLEYENAKSRIAEQQDTLREFNREGMRMFRLIILLMAATTAFIGALSPDILVQVGNTITSKSCAVSSEIGCVSVGMVAISSGILLLITAVLNVAAAGYEAVGVFNFTNPEDIYQSVKNPESSVTHYRKKRLKECIRRIDHNDRIISGIETFLGTGKVTLLLSIFGFATLFYIVLTDVVLSAAYWLGAFVLIFVPAILLFRYAPESYTRVDRWSLGYRSLYDRNYDEMLPDSLDDD